jgi:broad specificity phosphatase PhoE
MSRRGVLAAALAWPVAATSSADDDAVPLLRAGGVVVGLRHALAPGTFDPPGFRLGDCATQRNLDEEGRAQASRIGDWFARRALRPARVRSSPWCRCLDTARLAFGGAEAWQALGSPRGLPDIDRPARVRALREALAAASARRGRFEVWVTHGFVLSELAGASGASGEGLVMRVEDGTLRVLARLPAA